MMPLEVDMLSKPDPSTIILHEQSGADRRAWVRTPCELGTLYQLGPGQVEYKWMLASVNNIAPGGLALVLPHRFDLGTQVAITLIGVGEKLSRTIQAQVVHTEAHEESRWIVGCSFSDPLTEAELRDLLT